MLTHKTCLAAAFAIAALLQPTTSQCTTNWVTNSPLSTFNLAGVAVADWDPDGSGPMTERLVQSWHNWTTSGVLMWDDATTSWQPLGSNANSRVDCLLAMPNGDLYAGGGFVTIGQTVVNGVARWDGTDWLPLGLGVGNLGWPGTVSSMTALPSGEIVVGGSFSAAGGLPANCIAQWDGAVWSPVGSGTNGTVASLQTLPNGDVVAAGSFSQAGGVAAAHVARWDGSNWTPIGAAIPSHVADIEIAADGVGMVASSGSFVWRWDGASWTSLGSLNVYTTEVLLLPNGEILASGILGDVVRWNGSTWIDLGLPHFGIVSDIYQRADGDVLVVGDFRDAVGAHQPSVAVLASGCPASATSLGGGCGAALAAEVLPWTGGAVTTAATGLPINSLAVVVRSLATTSLPLATILPQGQAGCALLVAPDLLELLVPSNGAGSASLSLPNVPALAGSVVYEQWLSLQLGANLEIVDLSASNALALTVGVF